MLTYSELIKLESFDERLDYLKLWGTPHTSPRHMSEEFYKTKRWKDTRKQIINRDIAFDLGVFGMYIHGPIYVHHMNPISSDDILRMDIKLFDPENLICTSLNTHNTIHYKPIEDPYVERRPGDTKLW